MATVPAAGVAHANCAVADEAEVRTAAAAVRDDAFFTWNDALRSQVELDATAAAVVAGSARLRDLFGRSDEMDRLQEAVDELERLAEPIGPWVGFCAAWWR